MVLVRKEQQFWSCIRHVSFTLNWCIRCNTGVLVGIWWHHGPERKDCSWEEEADWSLQVHTLHFTLEYAGKKWNSNDPCLCHMNFFGTCDILWDSDSQQAVQYGKQIPVGCDFYAIQTSPEAHPAFCTLGIRLFLGVKQPEQGANHLFPSASLWIVWSHTSISPVCLHKHFIGWTIPLWNTLLSLGSHTAFISRSFLLLS